TRLRCIIGTAYCRLHRRWRGGVMAPRTWVRGARRRVKRGVLLALVCAGGIWTAQPALADVDMTGNFVGFTDVFVPVAGCRFDFVQSGTVLSITGDCEPYIGPFTLTGTIDPMTGDFSASGAGSGFCAMFGGVTITAGATLDSSRFSGTLVCGMPGFVEGFRCGNLQLDPGEACDLGFFDNGAPG